MHWARAGNNEAPANTADAMLDVRLGITPSGSDVSGSLLVCGEAVTANGISEKCTPTKPCRRENTPENTSAYHWTPLRPIEILEVTMQSPNPSAASAGTPECTTESDWKRWGLLYHHCLSQLRLYWSQLHRWAQCAVS